MKGKKMECLVLRGKRERKKPIFFFISCEKGGDLRKTREILREVLFIYLFLKHKHEI